MKTIEVSDEMYDKLVELSKEMLSQDPRCTRMPHLFQVRETKRIYGVDGNFDIDGFKKAARLALIAQDIANDEGTVIAAMGDGKRAARAIDAYLKNKRNEKLLAGSRKEEKS